jgi:hypothetical protein
MVFFLGLLIVPIFVGKGFLYFFVVSRYKFWFFYFGGLGKKVCMVND